MALKNDAPRIVTALKTRFDNVTRGWPDMTEKFPCVYVSAAGNTPAEYADNRIYITQLDYDIRIFSYEAETNDELAVEVDEIMEGLGYTRGVIFDSDNGEIRMKVMRYTIYM